MNGSPPRNSPSDLVKTLHRIGWLIPPFTSTQWIANAAVYVEQLEGKFSQDELEKVLARTRSICG